VESNPFAFFITGYNGDYLEANSFNVNQKIYSSGEPPNILNFTCEGVATLDVFQACTLVAS